MCSADMLYDHRRIRRYLPRRGITVRIICRSVDSSKPFASHCWVVERTISWLLLDQCDAQRLRLRTEELWKGAADPGDSLGALSSE